MRHRPAQHRPRDKIVPSVVVDLLTFLDSYIANLFSYTSLLSIQNQGLGSGKRRGGVRTRDLSSLLLAELTSVSIDVPPCLLHAHEVPSTGRLVVSLGRLITVFALRHSSLLSRDASSYYCCLSSTRFPLHFISCLLSSSLDLRIEACFARLDSSLPIKLGYRFCISCINQPSPTKEPL